jgi:hypothetical protein
MAERSNAAVLKTVVPFTRDRGFESLFLRELSADCSALSTQTGEMAERSNAAVSKTVVPFTRDRGFESPSLREAGVGLSVQVKCECELNPQIHKSLNP